MKRGVKAPESSCNQLNPQDDLKSEKNNFLSQHSFLTDIYHYQTVHDNELQTSTCDLAR